MALYLPLFSQWPYKCLIFFFRSQYQLPLPCFMADGLIDGKYIYACQIVSKTDYWHVCLCTFFWYAFELPFGLVILFEEINMC